MDNLQKEIVDERRGQYMKTLGPTTVGSLSPFGLKVGGSVVLIGDPFQPFPYQRVTNRQSLWAKILGNEARFVAGHPSFSDPIQSIQPLRVEVDRSVTNAFRERETKWRRTNAEALKSF
jgi:hypothetical protein